MSAPELSLLRVSGADETRRHAANAAMDRYADGDDSAFSELYDELGPRLLRFALRQTRDRALAEDIVQQAMLQIHCARDRFRRGADVLPWAFAISRRLYIDMVRRKRHQSEVLSRDGAEDESADTRSSCAPDDMLEGARLKATLERVLAAMPEGQRDAFILVREEGLSVAQAAEVLGISVSATKVRAHRAYEALREAIAQWDQGRAP